AGRRSPPLAVAGELGDVVGDAVGEAERALVDELPERGRGDHLRLREEQPQRVVGRRCADLRLTERAEGAEPAVAGDRDLRAGVAPGRDVALDDGVELLE